MIINRIALFCVPLNSEYILITDKKTINIIMPNQKILAIDNLSLQEMDPDAELIPLMTPEDEEEMNNEALPEDIAILPLRNTVLFPGVVIPITAG